MTNADDQTQTEAALCEETRIARAVLADLRARLLTPGDDFGNVPRVGITYTQKGLQKMRAALEPLLAAAGAESGPEKKEGAPEAPDGPEMEVVTLIVAGASANGGRSCLCHVEQPAGSVPRRAFVMCPAARQKASTLWRGLRLEGCRQAYPRNNEVFEYHGPVPTRLGLPLPVAVQKKEARP